MENYKTLTKPKLIIHGGAWNIPEEYEAAHLHGIKRALNAVYPIMCEGIVALDAVETVVNILEEDDTYDAGRGAFLNSKGEIELDAIIVDGKNIDFGAVAGMRNILHPVSVARKVMEDSEHCFLIGKGANDFARDHGINELPPEELLTERELSFYNEIKNNPHFKTHHPFESPSDTVGCVALDIYGNIAAATSTGGTARKLPGRVGDSPILGAGAYADNKIGGISTTGWGESIMRSLLAKYTIDSLANYDPDNVVKESLNQFKNKIRRIGRNNRYNKKWCIHSWTQYSQDGLRIC